MDDDSNNIDEGSVEATATEPLALTSSYKVLGELSASDGSGVLGRNTATSTSGGHHRDGYFYSWVCRLRWTDGRGRNR